MKFWQKGITSAALACALALIGDAALAQQYPVRAIRIVVGFQAGGPTDVIARLIAQHISTAMGQPVVVENKTGANALIATEEVARANPDGYTLIFNSLNHNVNHILLPNRVKYDPIKSFAPVSLVATMPMVVVTGYDSPFGSLKDIIARGKADPGSITFGSAGNGGSAHLAGELFANKAGIKMTHVPFRGNAPALSEVMAGRISFMFYPSIGIPEYLAGKRLKVLAVAAKQRNPDFPGVATTDELGLRGLDDTVSWVGLLAPGGTPDAVVQKLSSQVSDVLAMPEAKERLRALGGIVEGGSPAKFSVFLKNDYEHWARIIKMAGVKGE